MTKGKKIALIVLLTVLILEGVSNFTQICVARNSQLDIELQFEGDAGDTDNPNESSDSMTINTDSKSENLNNEVIDVYEDDQDANKANDDVGPPQLKIIIDQENQLSSEIEVLLEKLKSQSRIKVFFIGPDRRIVSQVKADLERERDRIKKASELVETVENAVEKNTRSNQINNWQERNKNNQEVFDKTSNRFSLFGWLVGFFN